MHVLLFSVCMSGLCGFVLCACEDTALLKFGEVVFLSASVYTCVVCCVKLCYLIFVYEFENLMKIN